MEGLQREGQAIHRHYKVIDYYYYYYYYCCCCCYINRKQVDASLKEAERDGVHVPQTVEEYTAILQKQTTKQTSVSEIDDILDYDDYLESSEEEEEEEEEGEGADQLDDDDNFHDAMS